MKYFCKENILLASVLLLGLVTYGTAFAAAISGSVSSGVIPVHLRATPEEREEEEKLQHEKDIEAEKEWEKLTPEGKKKYLESLKEKIKNTPYPVLARKPPGAKPEESNAVSDFMSGLWFGYIKIPKKIIQYFQGSEPEGHLDEYSYQTEFLCVDPLCKETAAFQVLEKTPPETPAHGIGVTLGWIAFLATLAGVSKRFF